MHEPWIRLDNHYFSLPEIKSGSYPATFINLHKSSLDFCREWLNGKESFILQTSGSTGTPKKITVTRNQLTAAAKHTANVLGLQKNYTSLVCLDTRYIAGVMMLVRSLETGMNIVLVEPASNPLEKLAPGVTIDFAAMVPLQLETILKSSQQEILNKIKIILIGGAAINTSTVTELDGMQCSFFSTYGMTETLSHIALQKLNGANAHDFFQALSGITLAQDERGCLVIHAPHISTHAIITNDLVELLNSSQFRWLGRADNIINTGGVKVISEKIEASIRQILDELNIHNRFFVAALPDVLLGESVNLFLEGTPLSTSVEELIHKALTEALSKFERPKSIRYITPFVNTATGKINKISTIASI